MTPKVASSWQHHQHIYSSLLGGEGPAGDELVQLLVGVVDDELLEPVALRYLEAVQVEHADHVVLPRSLHLVEIKLGFINVRVVYYRQGSQEDGWDELLTLPCFVQYPKGQYTTDRL